MSLLHVGHMAEQDAASLQGIAPWRRVLHLEIGDDLERDFFYAEGGVARQEIEPGGGVGVLRPSDVAESEPFFADVKNLPQFYRVVSKGDEASAVSRVSLFFSAFQ